MKAKLTRVLFDEEMAKRIQSGEIEGKIVTRNGRNVRIVCWDMQTVTYPIVALVRSKYNDEESNFTYTVKGQLSKHSGENDLDLFLEIPEYMTFKDGDVIAFGSNSVGIFKEIDLKNGAFFSYATLSGNTLIFCEPAWTLKNSRIATEEEKKTLINALKSSKHELAKEYLKRFFGIEGKKECEFKPKDWIMCRSGDGEWTLCQFSHFYKNTNQIVAVNGLYWDYCIPYNDQTAHLLGTTDNWEELA